MLSDLRPWLVIQRAVGREKGLGKTLKKHDYTYNLNVHLQSFHNKIYCRHLPLL